ncbi:UNVERIFIED_CONTAM: hypothetical protein GTU68_015176, partial [Idotea baltica]|nr:hypothetical protein [Idotea baltica]
MKVALVNPEIPQNTGSIARTCAATKTDLHLIGKLGFEINEKRVRRAGLDYWPYVSLIHDESWEDFANDNSDSKFWYLSKFAENNYYDADFQKND